MVTEEFLAHYWDRHTTIEECRSALRRSILGHDSDRTKWKRRELQLLSTTGHLEIEIDRLRGEVAALRVELDGRP